MRTGWVFAPEWGTVGVLEPDAVSRASAARYIWCVGLMSDSKADVLKQS